MHREGGWGGFAGCALNAPQVSDKMNRKAISKFMPLLVAFLVMASAFVAVAASAANVQDSYGVAISDAAIEAGDLSYTKTAEAVADYSDMWDITIKLDGKDKAVTTDVVILVDRSLSTIFSISKIKEALNNTIDKLIPVSGEGNVKVALVSFGKDINMDSDFTNDANVLKAAVNGYSWTNAILGTFVQGAIKTAENMFDNRAIVSDEKAIILLSNGKSTFSYGVKDGYKAYSEHYATIFTAKQYQTMSTMPAELMDYDKIGGNSIGPRWHIEGFNPRYNVNCDNQAIAESNIARNAGIAVYTIGMKESYGGKATMDAIGGGSSYLANSEGLYQAMTAISEKIAFAANACTITDPMGEAFNMVSDPSDVKVLDKNGNEVPGSVVSYDADLDKFTIEIPSVPEELSPITVTYRVQFAIVPEVAKYPTNGETLIGYTDAYGYYSTGQFEVPEVGTGMSMIAMHYILADENGNLLDTSGGNPTNDLNAAEIDTVYWLETVDDADTDVLTPGTYYPVVPETLRVGSSPYKNYILMGFASVTYSDGNTVAIAVSGDSVETEANTVTHLYFAYVRGADTVKISFVFDGEIYEQYVQYGTYDSLEAFCDMGFASVVPVGEEFIGWSADPAGTEATYSDGEQVNLVEDTTLYALLQNVKYTVQFIVGEYWAHAIYDAVIGDSLDFDIGIASYTGTLDADIISDANSDNVIQLQIEGNKYRINLSLNNVTVEGVADNDVVGFPYDVYFTAQPKAGYKDMVLKIEIGGILVGEIVESDVPMSVSTIPSAYFVGENGEYRIVADMITGDIKVTASARSASTNITPIAPTLKYYSVSANYNNVYVAVAGIPESGTVLENAPLDIRVAPAGAPVKVIVTVTMGGVEIPGAFAYDTGSVSTGNAVIAAVTGDVVVSVSYEAITAENPTEVGQFPWWIVLAAVIVGLALVLIYYRSRKNTQAA